MEKTNQLSYRSPIFGFLLFGMLLIGLISPVSAVTDFIDIDDYIIDYSYDESDAVSGERFTITVTVTNEDNELRENIQLEFKEESPFEFVGDDDWSIGTLEPDESETKKFRLEVDEDAETDEYGLEFTLEDNNDDYEDFLEIEVKSDNVELIIGDLQSDPGTILPDMEDVKITVEIQNVGDGDAKFVRAKLILPSGFKPSNSFSDITNLGTIKEGESKEAVFYINTNEDLESSLNLAYIELEYKNDGHDKKEQLDFELPVHGIPQFSVSGILTNPDVIMQGGYVTLQIELTNIGEKEGKDISVKVFEKSDQPFEFEEKTNFVGTLAPGATGTAIFKFDVEKNGSPSTYLLNIQIRTVSDGNVLVSEETIPVTVEKSERNPMKILVFSLLGGTVILVILMVWIMTKKRKR